MSAVFEPKVEVFMQCVNCGKQLGVIESHPGDDVRIPDHRCAGPDQKLIDAARAGVLDEDPIAVYRLADDPALGVPPMNIPPDGLVRWNIDRDGGPYGAG